MSKDDQPKNGNGSNGIFVKFVLAIVTLLIVGGVGAALTSTVNNTAALTRLEERKAENSKQAELHGDIEARMRLLESSVLRMESCIMRMESSILRMDDTLKSMQRNQVRESLIKDQPLSEIQQQLRGYLNDATYSSLIPFYVTNDIVLAD